MTKEQLLAMSADDYMNADQLAFFTGLLQSMKVETHERIELSRATIEGLDDINPNDAQAVQWERVLVVLSLHGGVGVHSLPGDTCVLDHGAPAFDVGLEQRGGLLGRGRLAAWGVGAANHALWCAALLGATLGVLALLATRRYGFVWETTILPADTFVALSAALGALPGMLGFPVPDAATVVASGDAPMLDEAGRRAWAGCA